MAKRVIRLEPLTSQSFAPFGSVVANPTRQNDDCIPLNSINFTSANQGSALKFSDLSHMENYYHLAPSKKPGRTAINLFVCSPKDPTRFDEGPAQSMQSNSLVYDVQVLERHPYTTQTFVPLGLPAQSEMPTYYLVIVAPTLPTRERSNVVEELPKVYPTPDRPDPEKSSSVLRRLFYRARPSPFTNDRSPPARPAKGSRGRKEKLPNGVGMPDLARVRAFIAKGDQAVTYGAGTWHAPMAVVGKKSVDFVVLQYVNGVEMEDCQEVEIGKIPGANIIKEVSVVVESKGLEKARL